MMCLFVNHACLEHQGEGNGERKKVSQLSVKLKSARIWYAQVMLDYFSDLHHMHLMRSTTQDDFFSGKSDFKIWSDTFGVKINRYYADNGGFSEQPFRSKIEDSNQKK